MRTRVTRATFSLSTYGTFATIQATPLGFQEQVVRPFDKGCNDCIAYVKNYMVVGFEID
ncbi:MAG: hypothetical protein ACREJN_19590 [Nitrospiraceae bacterium]